MWQVLKRRASASRVFIDGVLSMLWSSISRDLGEAMKICEVDCDAEIVETVWDYAEAMLGLWYGVVWDYAETVVRCCRLRRVAIILGNGGNGLGKIKIVMGRD